MKMRNANVISGFVAPHRKTSTALSLLSYCPLNAPEDEEEWTAQLPSVEDPRVEDPRAQSQH
jgi:hypothetical protein